jgi:hypothetical protein
MVWDFISSGMTRSASLAKVIRGKIKADNSSRIFFIMLDFWLRMKCGKQK